MATGSSSSSSAANHGLGGWAQKKLGLPLGYWFGPSDVELVLHYLLNKILGRPLPVDIIPEIDLYNTRPEHLPIGEYSFGKNNVAFFFTCKGKNYFFQEERKGKNYLLQEERKDEAMMNGCWKGEENEDIVRRDEIVGFKRRVVFYNVEAGREERTNWVMIEYKVNPEIVQPQDLTDDVRSQIERFVVCKIRDVNSIPEDSDDDDENFFELPAPQRTGENNSPKSNTGDKKSHRKKSHQKKSHQKP